ncbi:DUF2452 domain-containing protein [Lacinutrix neustonica]|uniref:DUF2452 domain-containing protein n=1 Tax=Lacinutrix neustonica TaxID=2980107 RepID=UPI0028BE3BC9|nr:DUF2452 domain-containing protein [Lacinutrix neustonica]
MGAPAIVATDNVTWKNKNILKANKQIEAKYLELKAEYAKMMEELEQNNLVYNAKFNFEPIIGQTYHLYKDTSQNPFLSIIAPNECHFDFIGSFYLNSEHIRKKTDSVDPKFQLH